MFWCIQYEYGLEIKMEVYKSYSTWCIYLVLCRWICMRRGQLLVWHFGLCMFSCLSAFVARVPDSFKLWKIIWLTELSWPIFIVIIICCWWWWWWWCLLKCLKLSVYPSTDRSNVTGLMTMQCNAIAKCILLPNAYNLYDTQIISIHTHISQ